MKYLFVYFIIGALSLNGQELTAKKFPAICPLHAAYAKTLNSPIPSETEKKELQTQLNQIAAQITEGLMHGANPENIKSLLQQWDLLKQNDCNVSTNDIQKILITARSIQELARVAAHAQAQEAGLRSSGKVHFGQNGSESNVIIKKYITAQLNYETICTYLGIKP